MKRRFIFRSDAEEFIAELKAKNKVGHLELGHDEFFVHF